MAENLLIEVVYALPERQDVVGLHLPPGSTVEQAIRASGLLAKYPEIDLAQNKLGIHARLVKTDTPLRDRDRVEIYRPLLADPKEVRKQRAAEGKAMKKGSGEPGAD
ncbi:MAG: RnfH family protein [Betaproteobacteria bacterium HGW-Betaproteobacteria-11]|nr:MAG: RnfH family protein [Betaproteobacteria bacterium HGW-Betaproteobacteria-11]